MGSRGQGSRDQAAGDIVGQYELGGIGENKGKILNFFRYMDNTDEADIQDRFQREGEKLAEELSEAMVYRDDEAREEYNRLRRHLNGTYTMSDKDRASIPDFTQYIRSRDNFVRIGRNGLNLDTAYEELSDMYPSRFPRSIGNLADRLLRINEVMQDLRGSFTREASDDDKREAMPYIFDSLARAYNEIRRKKGRKGLQLVTPTARLNSSRRGRYDYEEDEEELPFF